MELVADLTLVLMAALAGGYLAHRLGQPLLVGYILAGVVIGPFTGGFTVAHVQGLEELAEVGVALLLFSLGLEVSFRQLASVRGVAIGGAAVQIVLTIALGAGLGRWLGWTGTASLWLGAIVALSSTMVALKTLQSQGRLGTLSSRVMLGMLVTQDLSVVPLMVILPALGQTSAGLLPVVMAILRAAVLLVLIVVVATRLIPRLMALVVRGQSRELFLLSTMLVAVGVGYAAWMAGLSAALGAFIAGLVVSESDYAHQALSDIVPLRDLFGMLFFVTVGMLLDPVLVWRQLPTLVLVIVVVAVGKAVIVAGVVRLFGYRRIVPLASGLTLFQVGEFAFVLATVGRASGALTPEFYALVLNTAVVTMAATPLVSSATPWIYRRFAGRAEREAVEPFNMPLDGLDGHVVVAGAGRVGRTAADALARLHQSCMLIELDDRHVRSARAAGLPVIYGDASQPVVLEAARVARARVLLITVPALPDVRAIMMAARRLHPGLAVVARADGPDAVRDLRALGVEHVTSPEFEAAAEMTRQTLQVLDVPAALILSVPELIRRDRYAPPD
ncbi:MAG: cation:proton antiporter [Acidobacteriota bacterium]|nr:cation:proton antiporter [Acidobacteriota bacterium]